MGGFGASPGWDTDGVGGSLMLKYRDTCDYSSQFGSCVDCMLASRFGDCRAKRELESDESPEDEKLFNIRYIIRLAQSEVGRCDTCGPSGRIRYNVVRRDYSVTSVNFDNTKYLDPDDLTTAHWIIDIPCPNCDPTGYLRGKRGIVMQSYGRSAFDITAEGRFRFMERFNEKREYYRELLVREGG